MIRQIYNSEKDFAYRKARDREYFRLAISRRTLLCVNLEDALARKNIYGELEPTETAPNDSVRLTGRKFPFQLRTDPPQKLLEKFGLDSPADAIVVFSIGFLERVVLPFNSPKIGDRINDVNGYQYEIKVLREGQYFAQSGKPLQLIGTASRTRDVLEPDEVVDISGDV